MITFIKKRIDIKHETAHDGASEIKNEFSEECIFVTETKSKQSEDRNEGEEDSKMEAESEEDDEGECFFEDEEASSNKALMVEEEKDSSNQNSPPSDPHDKKMIDEKEVEASSVKDSNKLSVFSSGEKTQIVTKQKMEQSLQDKENQENNTESKEGNFRANSKKITLNLSK